MLLNTKERLSLFAVLMATVVAVEAVASAEVSYHLVRFPEIRDVMDITDSGVILAGDWGNDGPVIMLVEPARDAAGNPVWDSNWDGIADGYDVIVMNQGEYQGAFGLSINESMDVVGYGWDQDSGDIALLWLNAFEGNPPMELGQTFNARNVFAPSINDKGQVVAIEYADDWSGEAPSDWWMLWKLSLINPKDTDGDGTPDLWNEDLNGDGYNDLMVNLAIAGPGLGGCTNCSVGRINNLGEVAGVLTDSDSHGYVIVPNAPVQDLGPDIGTLAISDSGVVVGTATVWGEDNRSYRWQIDATGNVSLVATEVGAYYMTSVNDAGRAVGYTDKRLGKDKIVYTTYLWDPDLTIVNLADLLDNPSRTAKGLRCLEISDTGCIIGGIYDNYPDDVDAFIAVPIVSNTPPEVSINSPEDGSVFDSGATISFSGTAYDAEDGDLTGGLVWTSNIDSLIGSGGSFSTPLSDGIHTITASVTDSGGKTGSDSITITVGTAAPGLAVVSISPDTVQAGTSTDVTITGSGFVAGAQVTFEGGIGIAPSAKVTSVNSTIIEATVTAHKNAKTGIPWDVRVTNPDGSTGVLTDGFEVTK